MLAKTAAARMKEDIAIGILESTNNELPVSQPQADTDQISQPSSPAVCVVAILQNTTD
jgi:hypothetical protein